MESIAGVKRKPSAMMMTPTISERISEVCTASCTSWSCRAPIYRATTTLTPLPMPIRKPVNSVTRIEVDPTDPSASGPANCPTTATSDMLNSTCSTFVAISGRENRIICWTSGPCVRSCDLDAMILLLCEIFRR